ncbi:MAG TPA: hypothetical protein VIJ94_08715 [Caulobacteraceae bacterium]
MGSPKPRAPRLKVFQTQLGFFDSVVAAPSQAAALRAWGTHQDLFAAGDAKITTDKAAVAAALEHPETPLQRAVGTHDAFGLQPSGLPKTPPAPKRRPKKAVKSQPPKPAADRSKLDAAEAALRRLDQRRKREEEQLVREQSELDARRSAAHDNYVEAHRTAVAAQASARAAYRAAGGTA